MKSTFSKVWPLPALLLAATLFAAPAAAQNAAADQSIDRSESYYHFALGHLYQQLAMQFVRQEYVDRAIDEYQAAIQADPDASFVREELIELFARTNRLDEAVALANEAIARNPNDASMFKLLGRIYRSYAADREAGFDQEMLRSSLEQYEKALEIAPDDFEALIEISTLYRAAGDRAQAQSALEHALELKPSDSATLSALASLYLEAGETEKGIEALERATQSGDDNDGQQLRLLGSAYEQAGRFRDAADTFERLLKSAEESGGNSLPIRRSLAQNLTLSNQFEKAKTEYEVLLRAEPRNPEYHLRLSQILRQQRRFDEARDRLVAARELDPDSLEINYNEALLLEAEGRYDEAITGVEAILTKTEKSDYSPRDQANRIMFLEYLASLQRSNQDADAALAAYDRIAKLDPATRPRVVLMRVEALRGLREHNRALAESLSAIEEFPKDRDIVIQRAGVLAENGDANDGAKLLKKLLSGDHSDLQIHLALAQVYEKGKQFDKALDSLDEAMKLAQNKAESTGVLFTQGSVLERAKRFDQAEAKFRELLAADPGNSSALNYLGYMLADRSVKLDEAHDMVQQALDLEPGNGAYLDSLGWVYYRLDKLQLAERYLLRSLEQYGQDPVVHSHLGDVYFKLGKKADARRHWEKGLSEWRRSPKADQDPTEIAKLEQKIESLNSERSAAEPQGGADNKRR